MGASTGNCVGFFFPRKKKAPFTEGNKRSHQFYCLTGLTPPRLLEFVTRERGHRRKSKGLTVGQNVKRNFICRPRLPRLSPFLWGCSFLWARKTQGESKESTGIFSEFFFLGEQSRCLYGFDPNLQTTNLV